MYHNSGNFKIVVPINVYMKLQERQNTKYFCQNCLTMNIFLHQTFTAYPLS